MKQHEYLPSVCFADSCEGNNGAESALVQRAVPLRVTCRSAVLPVRMNITSPAESE